MVRRRTVGIARVTDTSTSTMRELGSQIDAESVGRALDEIEMFERRLECFAKENEMELRRDPVLLARFKHVADAAGIDISLASVRAQRDGRHRWLDFLTHVTSRLTVGSGNTTDPAHLDRVASITVGYCMREARMTGPFVPLPRVLRHLSRQPGLGPYDDGKSCTDVALVEAALARLRPFGADAYRLVLPSPEATVHDAPEEGMRRNGTADSGYVCCSSSASHVDVAALVAVASASRAAPPAASVSHHPCLVAAAIIAEPSSSGKDPSGPHHVDPGRSGAQQQPSLPQPKASSRSGSRSFSLRTAGVAPQRTQVAPPLSSAVDGLTVSLQRAVQGSFTTEEAADALGWTAPRAKSALHDAVAFADAWVDPVEGRYWLPVSWLAEDV